jgi:hypothetical protein
MVFSHRKLKFLIIIVGLLLSPHSYSADMCTSEELSESFVLLNDYMACIAGSENDCTTMMTATMGKVVAAGGAANFKLAGYSAAKLEGILKAVISDAKKLARDSNYAKRIAAEVGGPEIDKYIKENGGSIESAQKRVAELMERLKKTPIATEEAQTQLLNAKEISDKLGNRASLEKSNQQVIQSAIDDTKKINQSVIEKVTKVDEELAKSTSRLSKASTHQEKTVLKASVDALKKKKSELLGLFQGIDTQVKVVADKYNPELERTIAELKSQMAKYPERAGLIKETIAEISKKKIKVAEKATGAIPRFMLNVDGAGFSVVDANGAFKLMPEWAKQNRLAAIKEFPNILLKSIQSDPTILDDGHLEKLKFKLADGEHERYREHTQKRLINSYEQRRRLVALTGETLPDVGLPLDKSGSAQAGAKLNQVQRETLMKYQKANWLEVDIPFEKLSKENIDKTVTQVGTELASNLPFWEEGKPLNRMTKFFLPRPRLGSLARKGMRYGMQGGLTALTFWFDYYDLREMGYGIAFNFDYVKENMSGLLDSQCRMPQQQALGAKDMEKEHSQWFCGCETSNRKVDKVSPLCQAPASEMDAKTKEYCQLALMPGRDRDLMMAKKLKETKGGDAKMKEIFRSAAGCDVLKNYHSHCRLSTSNITDQGLYFMNVIRQNKLQKQVTDLCPDVCSHWSDVAKRKVKQLVDLQETTKLPTSKEENKAEESCPVELYSGPAPENFEKRKHWKRCQPPIQCQSDGRVRVNLNKGMRDLEYYELKFSGTNKTISSALHMRTDIKNRLNERGNSYLATQTKPTFNYEFDKDGGMSRIQLYDWGSSEITETVAAEDVLGRFKEYAYNADSFYFSGRDMGEFAISRRIEILLMQRKARSYCCQNSWQCEDPDDVDDNESIVSPRGATK